MINITKEGWLPNDVIDAVQYLKSLGYETRIDFDFEYYPPSTLMGSALWSEESTDRYVIFRFYKEELASYFLLRFD